MTALTIEQPVFETERLHLSPLVHADYEALIRLDQNREVMRYITGRPRTREEILANIRKHYRNPESPAGTGAWSVRLHGDDRLIGLAMLKLLDGGPDIEVGYRLHPSVWGKGFATEAAQRLVQYGFEELHLDKIVGVVMEANIASRHVLEKCGLRFAGRTRAYGMDNLQRLTLMHADWQSGRKSKG